MKELLNIYIIAFLMAIIFELFFTLLSIPLAAKHKFKNIFSVKEYMTDALLLNLLITPLIAFSFFAFIYIKKISNF
ncbi:MAG: hypothetical protein LBS28_04755 [Streptococcaceae bacterium]|nr:hypothetical protein [Streptococcaceae bacterium]